MSRSRLVLLTALAALAVPVAASAKEPTAPASAAAIRAYHDSGEWAKDTKTAFATATKDLSKALAKKAKGTPTLVLDIDDTTLSTYACQDAAGAFGSGPSAVCVVGGKLPVIPEARTLARTAQKKKVKLVFITARPEGIRALTITNLKAAGFTKYTLIMKPNTSTGVTAATYKSGARATLVRGGARILVNVGDQKSDLSGGFAEYAVKVPNPMYVTK